MKTFLVLAVLGKVAAVVGPLPGGHEACEVVREIRQEKVNQEFAENLGLIEVVGTNLVLRPQDVWLDCYDSETQPELDMEWSHPFR